MTKHQYIFILKILKLILKIIIYNAQPGLNNIRSINTDWAFTELDKEIGSKEDPNDYPTLR